MHRSVGPRERVLLSVSLAFIVFGAMLAPVATAAPSSEPPTPDTDNTVTHIHVYPNGTAEWSVTIRTRLDTDEDVEEYEAFQSRFRDNTSRYVDPFSERMRAVVARASEAVNREMHARDFTASTTIQEVPRRWGIVTYRFTWTNFATTEDERLIVGDVFEGGFYLASNDTLEIEGPTGYDVSSVEPEPVDRDDGNLTWVGREDFEDERPHVVFTPASGSTWPGLAAGVGGVLLVGLVGLSAYVVWQRQDRVGAHPGPGQSARGPDEPFDTDAPVVDEADDPTVGETVLTDEERVRGLLEANGGRMRQAAISEELDWSTSKTSRVVGDLVDEGTAEKLRLGRENLIDIVDE